MKVQIVYLNPEDDIHSAIDMLSWVKAPRALLVWPDRGKVLSEQLDLVLLQRYSSQRKIEIGLLTFDTGIRNLAAELSIPVFDSMDDLHDAYWNTSGGQGPHIFDRRNDKKAELVPKESEPGSLHWFERSSRRKRVLLISMLAIVGMLILLTLMPSATVSISPVRTVRTIEFEVIPTTADYQEAGIHTLSTRPESLEVSGSFTDGTSGMAHVPVSIAEGTVVFTNLSTQQVVIPIYTIVRTLPEGGIRYRTTKPAKLPGENGSMVEVSIEALTPGQIGNVSENSIIYIDGSLGLLLNVANPKALRGGRDAILGRVNKADLDLIEEKLLEELFCQAEKDFQDSLPSERILVDGTVEAGEIHERNFSNVEGEISESVSMGLVVEFVASSLSIIDIEGLALEVFTGRFPQGYEIVADSMVVKSAELTPREGSEGKYVLIRVELETYRSFNSHTIKAVITGQRPSEAFSLLFEQLDLAFTPRIEIKPAWFPVLPLLRERIELRWETE